MSFAHSTLALSSLPSCSGWGQRTAGIAARTGAQQQTPGTGLRALSNLGRLLGLALLESRPQCLHPTITLSCTSCT